MLYLDIRKMKKINRICIFPNNNSKSLKIASELENKLKDSGFIISKDYFDLAISVGGDGAFLRMVKNCNFNSKCLYVGVNTGTLCFAGEIYPSEIDSFIEKLKISEYKIEKVGALETKVYTEDSMSYFFALNEIVIRDYNLNTASLDIKINNKLLENFKGDGILISTSFGSTAYNLSFGGSIVYNCLHTLQITPIAPLNSNSYKTLRNSVIVPENNLISVFSNKDLIITVDGGNNYYKEVSKIETAVKKKKIKLLRLKEYDYTLKINEKFL